MKNWKKQFKDEFGIHFKDCPEELDFAIQFIEELRQEDKKRLEDRLPKAEISEADNINIDIKENGYLRLSSEKGYLDKIKQIINEIYQ